MSTQVPSKDVEYVPLKAGEHLSLGNITLKVIEDGSHTESPFLTNLLADNRIGIAEFILPPHTPGPPAHWHEMHDECFTTTKGTVRFHVPGKPDVDCKVGEWTVVPPRAPHTFSNPFDEEARFINTYTPAYYINYFRMLAGMIGEGEGMTPAKNIEAMSHFATLPVPKEYLEKALQEGEGTKPN